MMGRKKNGKRKKLRRRRPRGESKMSVVMPFEHSCLMKYTSNVIGMHATPEYASIDWYLNSVFEPEVSGLDTSSANGFNELKLLYANWRVESVNVSLMICNEEAFEIVVAMAPSVSRLKPSITSAPLAIQLGEMPWGKTITLGRNSGQNRGQIKMKINIARLVGNSTYYHGDLGFVGSDAARPIVLQYITLAAAALSGNNLTNGVTFAFKLEYKIRWFARIYTDVTGFRFPSSEQVDFVNATLLSLRSDPDINSDESEVKKDAVISA